MVGIIVVLVIPSFVLLFRLAQSGRLGQTLEAGAASRGGSAGRGGPTGGGRPRHAGMLVAVVMALVTAREIQRLRGPAGGHNR